MYESITESSLLSGKRNLLRMRQELRLTDAERAIVDRGIAALDQLLTLPEEEAAGPPAR
jgi:hypothetical protein